MVPWRPEFPVSVSGSRPRGTSLPVLRRPDPSRGAPTLPLLLGVSLRGTTSGASDPLRPSVHTGVCLQARGTPSTVWGGDRPTRLPPFTTGGVWVTPGNINLQTLHSVLVYLRLTFLLTKRYLSGSLFVQLKKFSGDLIHTRTFNVL